MFKKILVLLALSTIILGLAANVLADSPGEVKAEPASKKGALQTPNIISPPSVAATSLHQWALNRMVTWIPPGRSLITHAIETPEEGKARYEEIADAAISVAFDPNEKPIFSGKYGRSKTLALILAVAFFESTYRKDIDLGIGPLARGDNGQSWCMMQIMLGRPGVDGNTRRRVILEKDHYRMYIRPIEYVNREVRYTDGQGQGWGGGDLITDRQKCFRAGLHLIRKSFDACPSIPIVDRLSVYGSGRCISGMKGSRIRVKKAQKWLATDKPPLTDAEVLNLLHPPKVPVQPSSPVNVGPISKVFSEQPPRQLVRKPVSLLPI